MNELKSWPQQKAQGTWWHAQCSLAGQPPDHWPEAREAPEAGAEWSSLLDISEDEKQYMLTRQNRLMSGGTT